MATRIGKGLLAWCLLWLPALAAAASVDFSAQIDRQRLALDESLRLELRLSVEGGQAGEVQLPVSPDFEVISRGRSDQTSIDFSGGSLTRRRVRTYTLILQPLREGLLRIPPAEVEVQGQRYRSEALEVVVLPAGAGGAAPPPGPAGGRGENRDTFFGGPSSAGERDVFFQMSLDRDQVWLGEQAVLSLFLYARVDISGVDGLRLPKLDGLWVGDIASPTRLNAQTQVVDGLAYRRYLVSRKALFPLRSGKVQLDPASIDVSLSSFPFGRSRKLTRNSEALELEVLPLPEGAPAGFSPGNVGRWALRAELEPRELQVGEALTLRLIAAGSGNPASLELPRLPPLEGVKHFEPSFEEQVEVSRGSYGGEKRVEIVLLPERPGTLQIPSLEWAIFDVEAGRYRKLRTEPFEVEVRAKEQAASVAPAPGSGSGLGLLPPRPVISVAGTRPLPWQRPWFWPALLLGPLLALGALALPALHGKVGGGWGGRRQRAAAKVALRRLQVAADRPQPGVALYEEIQRSLLVYLEERSGAELAGLRREELGERLLAAGVGAELLAGLMQLLEGCDEGRFAPGARAEGAGPRLVAEAQRWVEACEAGWRAR